MALTTDAVWQCSWTFRDTDRNIGQATVCLPGATTAANVETFMGSMSTILQALSNATLVGWSYSKGAIDPDANVADEASDSERKGSFTFQDANGFQSTLTIPSIDNAKVVDRSNVIPLDDTDVAAYADAIITGLGGVAPTNVRGVSYSRVVKADKTHRRSSKG